MNSRGIFDPPPRKLRVLIRSAWGESLPLALRLQHDGHDVRMAIDESVARQIGRGLIRHCEYDEESVAWADLVFFDCNNEPLPDEAEKLMQQGKPCLGSSRLADRLEHDRAFASEVAAKAGLHVPLWESFAGPRAFTEAEQWMKSQKLPHGVVFKANTADVGTQVAEDVEQMMRLFDYLAARFQAQHAPPDFILQKVIEGIEVSTEAWWDGSLFSLPNGTLERNKLMAGDIGEKIGSAGETVWVYDDLRAPLVKQLILPLASALGDKYRGPIDVNAIVDTMGTPWWLEFTPRAGYGALHCLLELLDDPAALLMAIATGQAFEDGATSGAFATGVMVHIPPYPILEVKDKHMAEDLPITGYDPEEPDGIQACEIMLDDRGRPITSGPTGLVCEVVGVGDTIADSAARAYATVESVHVPKMRYRNDIGEGAEADYRALVRHHLLEGEAPREPVRMRQIFGRR